MSDLHYLREPQKYLFDGCKLIYHQDKLQDFFAGKRITPIHIDMGIHKGCNIRCIYCYGIKQVPSAEYIPTDRLLMLAEDAVECGIKSLAIIGDGEPTMNKGLYPFVQHGKKLGLDMSVGTNGLLLTPETIRILTESLVWLRFNISGVDKYDYIHGTKGGLSRFEAVIRSAIRQRGHCTIGLQMVCIPECFSEIVPLAQKAKDWGVDYLVIKQYSDPGCKEMSPFDMQEYDKATQALRQAEGMSDEKTKIIVKWGAIQDTRNITGSGVWGFDRCTDLPFIFQISGNGNCYPCGYLFGDARYCYGSVIESRLRDILTSNRYWDVIHTIKNMELKNLCRGQCRHCETNKFMDKLKKAYICSFNPEEDLYDALVQLCGSKEAYTRIMNNPPVHRNFV